MISIKDISLEKLQPQHADDIYMMVIESLTELLPWMDWAYSGYNFEDTTEWVAHAVDMWEKKEEYNFLIRDIKRDVLAGCCGLMYSDTDKKTAQLGYWVRSNEVEKGIATAAAELAVRFAFKEMGVSRVEILVDTANEASIRVIEKIRGVKEGVLKNRLVVHGEERDAFLYSLTK